MYAGTRQILNLQEILDQCNDHSKANWAQALNGTRWRSVECRTYSFGKDLLEGMAVAQQVRHIGLGLYIERETLFQVAQCLSEG